MVLTNVEKILSVLQQLKVKISKPDLEELTGIASKNSSRYINALEKDKMIKSWIEQIGRTRIRFVEITKKGLNEKLEEQLDISKDVVAKKDVELEQAEKKKASHLITKKRCPLCEKIFNQKKGRTVEICFECYKSFPKIAIDALKAFEKFRKEYETPEKQEYYADMTFNKYHMSIKNIFYRIIEPFESYIHSSESEMDIKENENIVKLLLYLRLKQEYYLRLKQPDKPTLKEVSTKVIEDIEKEEQKEITVLKHRTALSIISEVIGNLVADSQKQLLSSDLKKLRKVLTSTDKNYSWIFSNLKIFLNYAIEKNVI